jgi:NADH dehydrogenase FAD-containing subunit
VLKVQHKPIKRSKLGFKRKEQKKPKRTLVWRTGLSGAPGTVQVELFTFGFLESHSAIIHRTVRWVTGLSGVPVEQQLRSATVDSNGRLQREQCVDNSRRVRAAPEGAPDSEQCLSSAAPDCPVPPSYQSSNVKTVRTITVG